MNVEAQTRYKSFKRLENDLFMTKKKKQIPALSQDVDTFHDFHPIIYNELMKMRANLRLFLFYYSYLLWLLFIYEAQIALCGRAKC